MHYARMIGHDYHEGYYFVTINTTNITPKAVKDLQGLRDALLQKDGVEMCAAFGCEASRSGNGGDFAGHRSSLQKKNKSPLKTVKGPNIRLVVKADWVLARQDRAPKWIDRTFDWEVI